MDCFASLVMMKKEPSLRGFEKAVAISLWQPPHSTHTVIARVRRTRGNLVMATITLNPHRHCESS